MTSSEMMVSQTSALCDRVHRIYHGLAVAPSLSPSVSVNALFSELVLLVQTSPPALAAGLLGDPVLSGVRERLLELCAEGEYLLESHWAKRILESPPGASWAALEAFPYYSNYERLVELEVAALTIAGRDGRSRGGAATGAGKGGRRALFIGSGPLPLTSILLARRHGFIVTNLDLDAGACLLGRRLASHLGSEDGLEFVESDILRHDALDEFDVVFVAALVGRHRAEKRAVLYHIARRLSEHAAVVVRSAHHLRTLLYPGVELDDLSGLVPLLELHPHDDVINSVIIARPAIAQAPPLAQ